MILHALFTEEQWRRVRKPLERKSTQMRGVANTSKDREIIDTKGFRKLRHIGHKSNLKPQS